MKIANLITLMRQFGHACTYCGRHVAKDAADHGCRPSRDHDLPKIRGGHDGTNNEVLACIRCNNLKNDMTGPEFRHVLETGKLHPDYIEWRERKILLGMGRTLVLVEGSQPVVGTLAAAMPQQEAQP